MDGQSSTDGAGRQTAKPTEIFHVSLPSKLSQEVPSTPEQVATALQLSEVPNSDLGNHTEVQGAVFRGAVPRDSILNREIPVDKLANPYAYQEQADNVLTSPSHNPTPPSLDEEHGPLMTMNQVKVLIQRLIHAAKTSSVGSFWEQFAVKDQDTASYLEEPLVAAIQKLIAQKGAPSNTPTPGSKEMLQGSAPIPASHPLEALGLQLAEQPATALPSPSHAQIPPNSPKPGPPATADVESLIRTAIMQAKAAVSSRSALIWDQPFGLDPGVQLLSTLEAVLTATSKREPPAQGSIGLASNQGHEGPCGCERLAAILEKRLVVAGAQTPPSSSASEAGGDESEDKGDGNTQAAQATKLDYRRVDEVWIENEGKYKIVKSIDSTLDKLDQFLFVVRERTDKYTLEKTTYVDVKSTWIRDVLREICRDIRSVSLAENKPSIELNALFHVRADLRRHKECTSHSTERSTAEKHLDVFLRYLDDALQPTGDRLSVLLAERKITYDLLWALFKPNAEVYTTCKGTQASRCVLFNQLDERKDMTDSRFMHLETRYLGSDGKALGEVTTSSSIPIFRGARRIELLPAYPLQYHPKKGDIRKQLEECGRKYVSLLGIRHRKYKGRAFDYDNKGNIVALHVEGEIMVDFDCFHENMPNYPSARVQQVRRHYSVLGHCDVLKPVHLDPKQLEPGDLVICSPTVLGFSLAKKRFLEFAVAHVGDIEWGSCSFDDVKIPRSQKKAIYALTETYLSRGANVGLHDLVQGKGLGINFLLYGPPGVGKTLTAETLAATFKTPLYTVAAGQIGVDHLRVEKYLRSIFKIASRWQAILLLDEADVFLAERALDPHINALVSVFLRELEHFDGILFLTTNRMQTFDPAILSRIHLPLRYDPLKKEARGAVWRCFVKQARTKAGPAVYDDSVIKNLAEKKLNGREIRNTVLVGLAMAEYDGKVVDETYLRESVDARKQLGEDFQGAGAVESTNSYL